MHLYWFAIAEIIRSRMVYLLPISCSLKLEVAIVKSFCKLIKAVER